MTQHNNRSRNYCFTDFILDKEFYNKIQKEEKIKYMIIGEEICPTTNNKHYQGYVYFENARTLKSTMKLFNPRHVEICKGDSESNIKYCSKEKNIIFEIGEKPKSGKRNDLIALKEKIKEGTTVEEIIIENPNMYHQYGRTLNKIEEIYMRRNYRTEMTIGIWYYGPTGSGKSHTCFEDFSPLTHYVLNVNDNGWWDGYTQQETVIINEFRGQIPFGELLDLLDKYPKTVKRRNREPIPFISKKIIITSCKKPEEIYSNVLDNEENIDQLYRRISLIKMTQRWSIGNTVLLTHQN